MLLYKFLGMLRFSVITTSSSKCQVILGNKHLLCSITCHSDCIMVNQVSPLSMLGRDPATIKIIINLFFCLCLSLVYTVGTKAKLLSLTHDAHKARVGDTNIVIKTQHDTLEEGSAEKRD